MQSAGNNAWHIVSALCLWAVIMVMMMTVYLDTHLGKGREGVYAGSEGGVEAGGCVFAQWAL